MRACLAVQVLLAALITQSMAQPESGLPCKLRRIHALSTCNYACWGAKGAPILFSEIGFCVASCSYIYIYIYNLYIIATCTIIILEY